MSQTILDLWSGNIAPCEHCGAHDPEANQLLSLMERNRESLQAGLTNSQAELLQKYIDCQDEYLLRMLELSFCEGFCLGSRLTAESAAY